jgi:hypothetical protein
MASAFLDKQTVFLGLAALVMAGVLACGDDRHDREPTAPGSVDAAGIAGTWNGTLSIEGGGDAFAVTFDCAGAFVGTVGGQAVSGQVTAFDPTTGTFSATMTVGNETRSLAGVAHADVLTGRFTSDTGPGGDFVVSFAAGTQVVCDFSVDVSADLALVLTSSTCSPDGNAPYSGDGSALFTANGAGGVDVAITLQGPPQVALIGTSATSARTISFSAAGLPDGALLDMTATVEMDGTLSGTFAGRNDGCSELTGTFTGTFDQ